MLKREPYTYPDSLYVLPDGWVEQCASEDDRDVRHLGRVLTFVYICPRCGPQYVILEPDYPYCGANSIWTCSKCYSVMRLKSPIPVNGKAKSVTLESIVRKSF